MYEPFYIAFDSLFLSHVTLISQKIAQSFEKYFRKLIDMFVRIEDVLSRCQVYQNLFPTNRRLLQVISIAYIDVIRFC